MLEIEIPDNNDLWDPVKREFLNVKGQILRLEHSLISISKWEEKWKIPYLHSQKTGKQIIDYVRCMTINQVNDKNIYLSMSIDHMKQIADYIEDPATATTIKRFNKKGGHSDTIVTSELIYYWMVAYNIPHQYEKWRLNRLLTLIEICEIKNQPPKKMSKADLYARQRAINAQNKARFHTTG